MRRYRVSPYSPKTYTSQIFRGEVLSTTTALLAGVSLTYITGDLASIPGILILIPGFLEAFGSINSSLSARLTYFIFKGKEVLVDELRDKVVVENLSAAFLLHLFASVVLGIFAVGTGGVLGGTFSARVFWIAIAGGLISFLLTSPWVAKMTVFLYDRGIDPDNVMGPIVTSMNDFVSVISLVVAISLVELLL